MLDFINKNMRNDGLVESILSYMDKIKLTPNLITYNTLMDFYCMNGNFQKAYLIFESLPSKGIEADNFSFSILIKGIKNTDNPNLDIAMELFEKYNSKYEFQDIIIYNSLLDVFISQRETKKADEIFTKILNKKDLIPDQITFNTLIKGCCKVRDFDNSQRYFKEMKKINLKPNRITYNSLMDLAVKVRQLPKALYFVEEMARDEISPDGYTYSIILNGLKLNNSKPPLVKSSLENIKKVIQANEFRLDEVFFNSILDVCSKYDFFEMMRYFYDFMRRKKIQESSITYGILIKAYGKSGEFEKAYEIFERMIDTNMTINDVTYGCILDACAKSGKMGIAMKIYDTLKKSKLNLNSIVFTTIIKGFIKEKNYEKAAAFFMEIKHNIDLIGMIITYNCALDVYVRNKDISSAVQLFNEI